MKRSFNPPKKRLKNEAFQARRDFSKNNIRQSRGFTGKKQKKCRANYANESSPDAVKPPKGADV